MAGTRTLRSSGPSPDWGTVLGAWVLAELDDAADRYVSAEARKNYAATSPITRAAGKKKTVAAR